jgi:autotransporter-associated beta strand protein
MMNGGKLTANGSNSTSGTWNFDGGVTTPGNATPATSTISGGNIKLSQSTATVFNVQGSDTVNVSSTIASFTGSTPLTKSGTGTLNLAGGNTYSENTTVNGGTLLVTGSISNSTTTVNNGGTIGGTGTLTTLNVLAGGNLNPGNGGNSFGRLNTGNLTLAGALNVDISGKTAGSLYDQVNVTGAVNLTGATLNLSLGSYVPNNGDMFFLVANDSSDALTGTFTNVPADGSTFSLGGQQWQVSYTANFGAGAFTGGNDVALMAVQAVPEPGAAVALIGGAGMLLGLRRRTRQV